MTSVAHLTRVNRLRILVNRLRYSKIQTLENRKLLICLLLYLKMSQSINLNWSIDQGI